MPNWVALRHCGTMQLQMGSAVVSTALVGETPNRATGTVALPSIQQSRPARVFCQSVWIELQSQAWQLGNAQQAFAIQMPTAQRDFVDERRTSQISHQVGVWKRRCQLQIG